MPAKPRLYVLLARDAPVGVVFRRGPSKQVLLVSWNVETDTFVRGQWLKGRVYEDRCDLSPDGDLLLYFAASQKPPYHTWTAISRPPYLTALALWPKGDTWGGGGLFEDHTTVVLDHGQSDPELADGFAVPPWLRVREFQPGGEWTLDQSMWGVRLKREGWRLTSAPGRLAQRSYRDDRMRWEPPQVWEKENPVSPGRTVLRMTHSTIPRDQVWLVAEYAVLEGSTIERLGRIEWADWDRTGDLLFAMDGALHRLRQHRGVLPPLENAEVIADFDGLKFETCPAPAEAKRWPAR